MNLSTKRTGKTFADFGLLKNRVTVNTLEKTSDGALGQRITPTLFFVMTCNVEHLGSKAEMIGGKSIRYESYEIFTRKKPVMDPIRPIVSLQFVLNDGTIIYPYEYSIVQEFIIFKCKDRNEG